MFTYPLTIQVSVSAAGVTECHKSNPAMEFSKVKRLSFRSGQREALKGGIKINRVKWIHVCTQSYLSAVHTTFEVMFVRKHSHLSDFRKLPSILVPRLYEVISVNPANSKNTFKTNIWACVSQGRPLSVCDSQVYCMFMIQRFRHLCFQRWWALNQPFLQSASNIQFVWQSVVLEFVGLWRVREENQEGSLVHLRDDSRWVSGKLPSKGSRDEWNGSPGPNCWFKPCFWQFPHKETLLKCPGIKT